MYEADEPRGATMKDVAARASVSLKTVSRVINGEVTVAADLRERVLEAAKHLGYIPDMGARSLRRSDRRTRSIGVLLGDVSNPFSAVILRAVEDYARPHGVTVIVGSIDEDDDREYALITEFVSRRVDGLLFTPVGDDLSYLDRYQRQGTPIVCLDRPPVGFHADCVLVDNAKATREGIAHLLEHGHQRIAYIGHLERIYTARERLTGYRDALGAAGILFDEDLVRLGDGGEDFGRASVESLLDQPNPPTAIFSARNSITMGAVRALADRNLGDRIALLGFDDFPLADLMNPGTSVIAQDERAMGEEATRILFSRIAGDTTPAQRIEMKAELKERGSGEIDAGL